MSEPNISSDPSITSDEQIIQILREHAGINPEEGSTRAKLISLAKGAGIKVDKKEPTKGEDLKVSKGARKPTGYTITITGTKDKPHVIVGVNGVMTQIKCDVEEGVRVKPEIVEVLRNARSDVYDDIRDDIGRVVQRKHRQVPVHQFSILETHFD